MVLPLVFAQAGGRMPIPTDFRTLEPIEIFGFPAHQVDLTPEHIRKIEEIAVRIIRSNQGNNPIWGVYVEGHADVVREAHLQKDARFLEKNTSDERAEVAFDALIDAIKRKSADEAFAKRIRAKSARRGMATSKLKNKNARTELERSQNRRVVFYLHQVTFIPPPAPPPEPAKSVIESRYKVRLLSSLIASAGVPMAKDFVPSPTGYVLQAQLEITDEIDRRKASFSVKALGGGLSMGATPVSGSITVDAGAPVGFKTFRLLGRQGASVKLSNFEGRVTIFMDTSATSGGGTLRAGQSFGGTLNFSFDALEANGMNTQPSVVRVPGGKWNVGVDGIDIGTVFIGTMSMDGSEKPL